MPLAVMSDMFNRYASGVRAHAAGVGIKQANVSSKSERGIAKQNRLGGHVPSSR